MGNTDTKIQYRKAVIQLTANNQSVDAHDPSFWSQFWSDQITSIQDIYTLIPASEIRALREEAPANLATLCYKVVERLQKCVENAFLTQRDQLEALNCIRLLTRLLPYIFEEPEWRGFFWSSAPIKLRTTTMYSDSGKDNAMISVPLAVTLLNTLSDLLFMPDFTASSCKRTQVDKLEDIRTLDSCEYIWEAGVGFAHHTPHSAQYDYNRVEIVKLLLTAFSETMYLPSTNEIVQNKWIEYFTSAENRHTLPLYTSLINIVFAYDPIGYGLPYNYILFNDSREPLVECILQLLCVTLEQNSSQNNEEPLNVENLNHTIDELATNSSNLFVNYLSRIHRDEDFKFILKGFSRLLNNPMVQTYLPGSSKKIAFHQELFILFWKFCDINKRFLYYVLKSNEILEILIPILYYLVDSRADTSKIGLMHIGVFILLLLTGERNFGVRLNKPYSSRIVMDVPVFTGTYADLLIIVFHKIITTSHHRLQPLYDCLLTIIVNISPYIKSLSMVTSNKLMHLLEVFTMPSYLFSNPTNHHLVFYLLEVFNNIIQYQFDGNSNLIYTIIRKRVLFYNLLNLGIDVASLDKALAKQQAKKTATAGGKLPKVTDEPASAANSMDDALPAKEAQPGTMKTTLAATPSIMKMTEKTTPISVSQTLDGTQDVLFNDDWKPTNEHPIGEPPIDLNFSNATRNAFKSEPLKNSTIESKATVNARLNGASSLPSKISACDWRPTTEWAQSWKHKLPLQTIMRLLQVLVPQVEKICIDRGLTDESEILKFLQHGTLVGLLPVPHPILIRKYQPNLSTNMWFKTYIWGVIYLRNSNPPIFYDTDVKLFEIQRVQ